MDRTRRHGSPLRVAHGDAVSALVTAAEARAALAAYEADDENDGPMVALAERALRTVVAQSAEIAVWRDLPDVSQAMHALDIAREKNDRLTGAIGDAAASLDGEHMVTCARWVNVHAPCDCIVGRVRATLAKAVQP